MLLGIIKLNNTYKLDFEPLCFPPLTSNKPMRLERFNEKELISAALNCVAKIMVGDPSHDVEHLHRVARNAKYIRENEKIECDKTALLLSIYFHDTGRFSTNRVEKHADKSAQIAQRFLKEWGYNKISTVTDAICAHNASDIPRSAEAKLLRDGDILDSLGIIGLVRCFSYGRKMKESAFETLDYFEREINECYSKLTTKTGRAIAFEKNIGSEYFLTELRQELRRFNPSKNKQWYVEESSRYKSYF